MFLPCNGYFSCVDCEFHPLKKGWIVCKYCKDNKLHSDNKIVVTHIKLPTIIWRDENEKENDN